MMIFLLGFILSIVPMEYTSKAVYDYISDKTNDPIIEWQTCTVSGQPFPIYQSDVDFYDKISPTFEATQDIGDKLIAQYPDYYSRTETGKLKVQIPTPTLCPEERQRRRLAFRNERKLYKRRCDFTGKDIISHYSPDKLCPIYHIDTWYSDAWSAYDFAQDISLDTAISHTIKQVFDTVPNISLMVKMNENCAYVNGTGNSKNCYMTFDTDFCEDSYYSSIIKHSQNIVDSMHVYYSQYGYDCINCSESYQLYSCYECDQSKYLYNCSLCSQCEYCYNCHNLVGKKYCINNQQYTKEEYEEKMKSYLYYQHYPQGLQRATYKVNSKGSYGNNIYGSDQCLFSHNLGFSQNLKYCDLVTDCHDSYDVSSFGGTTSHALECASVGLDCQSVYFSNVVTAGSHHIYCSYVTIGCKYLFGCSHMRNASYCIFNRQYTKEQRHNFVPQLIAHMIRDGEWGEFFDPSLSPFGYNETVAHEYYPLTRDEALARGHKRSDYSADPVIPANAQVLRAEEISDEEWVRQRDDDTIFRQVIICSDSGRPFMIQKAELAFYRKHNLPLPRKHPDVRHAERMALRPGRTLYMRNCDQCGEEMLSVYKKEPLRPSDTSPPGEEDSQGQKVYCETCYQQEVYG